jgi:NitT/TauT family transport system permease protein
MVEKVDQADASARPVTDDELARGIFAELRRTRRRNTFASWTIRLVVFGVFVGAWSLASRTGLIDPLLISTPQKVASAFVGQLSQSGFWTDAKSTFGAAVIGLLVGAVLGIFTGIVFSRVPILERALAPFLTLANSLPRAALAPVFILWFGLGGLPKVLVAASVVFFLILTATTSALIGIDHDITLLTRSLSMTPWQRFAKVDLPSALPSIVGGMRLGAVYAVLGAVVSEMVGAYSGLGQRLVLLTNNYKVAESFAVLLAMGIMAMTLDYAISLIERFVKSRTR